MGLDAYGTSIQEQLGRPAGALLSRSGILNGERPFDAASLYPRYARLFPEQMRLLRLGGVHPLCSPGMSNPYNGRWDALDRSNIGQHCLAVAAAAEVLARRLHRAGVLCSSELRYIIARALIHDAAKRYEIMRAQAAAEGLYPGDVHSEAACAELLALLIRRAIPKEQARLLAWSGREASFEGICRLLGARSGRLQIAPGYWPQKLVFLADQMTSSSRSEDGPARSYFLTLRERAVVSDWRSTYPHLTTSGILINEDDSIRPASGELFCGASRRCLTCLDVQQFAVREIVRALTRFWPEASAADPELAVKEVIQTALLGCKPERKQIEHPLTAQHSRQA